MDGLIDIHTHILPQVDDGARHILEAKEMIRIAFEDGTRVLVLTPHYRGAYRKNHPSWLRESFILLQQVIADDFPEMKLYLGHEIYYEKDVPKKLEAGQILTWCNSDYVLLEFSTTCLRSQVLSGLYEIQCCGYIPIIAHVERYQVFRKDPSLIDEVLDAGALIQLNAESIMGAQGFEVKRYCHTLLRQKKAHFVASDSHRVDWRPPMLHQCWEKVSKKYGEAYASQLFFQNAQAIMESLGQ